jgi:hypothetical protein
MHFNVHGQYNMCLLPVQHGLVSEATTAAVAAAPQLLASFGGGIC